MRRFLFLGVFVVGACGSNEVVVVQKPDPAADAGPSGCPDGEAAAADGTCEPVVTTDACAAGTREALGSATCVPVGMASCAPGFATHESGWGCRPVLPAAACTGATREALGSTACVPVGDCDAAFPPAGAIVVDASIATPDATHKKTIADGIAAASSGGTVAVLDGTYVENVVISKALTLVGRCPAKVTIQGADTDATVRVPTGAVTVKGLRIANGTRGLRVEATAKVTASDLVIESAITSGLDAFDGAEIDASRVVVRGTKEPAAGGQVNGVLVDGAKVHLTDSAVIDSADSGIGVTGGGSLVFDRSVVRDVHPRTNLTGGTGLRIFLESNAAFTESAIIGSRGTAIVAGQTKSNVSLVRSSVVDTKIDERPDVKTASAVFAVQGSKLSLEDSTIANTPGNALSAKDDGSSVDMVRSVITTITPDGQTGTGTGLVVGADAKGTMTDSVVVNGYFVAVQVDNGGALDVKSSIVKNVLATPTGGGKVPADYGGFGLVVNRASKATIADSTFVDATSGGLAVGTDGATLDLSHSYVARTKKSKGQYGHGVLSILGARLGVDRSVIEQNEGVAAVFDRGYGVLRGSIVRHNEVGIQVQGGPTLVEDDPGDASPKNQVFVTPDTRFIDNVTRVGSGEVALPNLL